MLKNKSIGPLKNLSITDGTPYAYAYGSPETIPAAKPATAQLTHTIVAGNCPVFSFPPASTKYVICAYIWGKNNTASAVPISYDVSLDSVSKTTGTYSVTASQFWTLQMNFEPVVNPVDSVVDFFVWESTQSLDVRGYAVAIVPTQVSPEPRLLSNFTFGSLSGINPATALGASAVPVVATVDAYYIFADEKTTYWTVQQTRTVINGSPYVFMYRYTDDPAQQNNKVTGRSHSSGYPSYLNSQHPHTLSYRILNTEGKL